MRTAVDNVNRLIAPAVIGHDVTQQRDLDSLVKELDGTPQKSKLGANAMVGVSLAVAKAAASSLGIPLYKYINANSHTLPVPMMNLINGGKLASNDLDFQEFILIAQQSFKFRDLLNLFFKLDFCCLFLPSRFRPPLPSKEQPYDDQP